MDTKRKNAGSNDPTPDEAVGDRGVASGRSPSPKSEATETFGAPRDGALPKHIGRYHLRRVIASGGMGTVYEAFQENPRRVVAVKVMRRGIASRSAMRRFSYEAQLLARLRDPGIAQVYEAGVHEDPEGSVPYFAMEYVPNAKAISAFARDKKLGIRQRLDLFTHVCDAVHHGHQKGIIHRDLKPSNILVDANGQVKVIDFGVARSTDSDLALTTLQTDVGQLIGTLQYMSPEQCDADPHDLDIRSDIYALGVVFFELLTERLPYEVRGLPIHQATRVIREQPPSRISSIDKTLRGDIETIALKALEKERSRRYQSAADFGADVRRYLESQPITARPPSVTYQVRIFARRNKALCGAAAISFFVLLGATVVSTSLYVRADRATAEVIIQRDRAEREAQTAGRVVEFLVDIFRVADPRESVGGTMTAREILDRGVEGLRTQLQEDRGIRVRLLHTLGRVYEALALHDSAEELLQEALTLVDRASRESRLERAEITSSLSQTLYAKGDADGAEKSAREAMNAWMQELEPDDPRIRIAESWVAQIAQHNRPPDEAERQTLVMALNFVLTALDPDAYVPELAAVIERIRRINRDEGREKALRYFAGYYRSMWQGLRDQMAAGEVDEAMKQVGNHYRPVQSVPFLRSYVPAMLAANSDFFMQKGEPLVAEAFAREALSLIREVRGPDHWDVAFAMHKLASVLDKEQKYDESERLYRDGLALAQRLADGDHPDIATMSTNLGLLRSRRGDHIEGERLLREGLAMRRRLFDNAHPDVIGSLCTLATQLNLRGAYDEAEHTAREACATVCDGAPARAPGLCPKAQAILGKALIGVGRFAEAELMLRESYSTYAQHPKASPGTKRVAIQRLVELFSLWDENEPGLGHAQEAERWKKKLADLPAQSSVETMLTTNAAHAPD